MATSFLQRKPIQKNRRWRDSKKGLSRMTDANHIAGNSKDGNTNLSFTDASISEEPSAGVPQVRLRSVRGQSGNWLSYRDNL